MIWYDMIWFDLVFIYAFQRMFLIWFDMIWFDMILWYGLIWWYDMIWCDNMIWYDMLCHDLIWYGRIFNDIHRMMMIWYLSFLGSIHMYTKGVKLWKHVLALTPGALRQPLLRWPADFVSPNSFPRCNKHFQLLYFFAGKFHRTMNV